MTGAEALPGDYSGQSFSKLSLVTLRPCISIAPAIGSSPLGAGFGAIQIDDFKFQFLQQPYGWPAEKVTIDMPSITNIPPRTFRALPNLGEGPPTRARSGMKMTSSRVSFCVSSLCKR